MLEKNKKITLGCDHAGYNLKEFIKKYLEDKDFKIKDFGTFSEESVDYPDFVHPLASEVNTGEYTKGLIICGSGNGVAITANKYPNVRAALCWNKEIALLARQHNDANILALPARFINFDIAIEIVEVFLKTKFEGGRHQLRVEKIKIV